MLDFIKPKVDIVAGLGTIQLVCVGVIFYYFFKLKETKVVNSL
ncbi:hypothetical protein [Chryseobacterium sp. POE27]